MAWRYGNEDPYWLYHGKQAGTPPCPQPFRLKYFYYGMAAYANEEMIEKLKVTTGQGGGDRGKAQRQKREIIMPGGYRGTK